VSYRPITDVWILARPKVKYYGAYPNGFLERARCSGGCAGPNSGQAAYRVRAIRGSEPR
jgi:hypothetical protein